MSDLINLSTNIQSETFLSPFSRTNFISRMIRFQYIGIIFLPTFSSTDDDLLACTSPPPFGISITKLLSWRSQPLGVTHNPRQLLLINSNISVVATTSSIHRARLIEYCWLYKCQPEKVNIYGETGVWIVHYMASYIYIGIWE